MAMHVSNLPMVLSTMMDAKVCTSPESAGLGGATGDVPSGPASLKTCMQSRQSWIVITQHVAPQWAELLAIPGL